MQDSYFKYGEELCRVADLMRDEKSKPKRGAPDRDIEHYVEHLRRIDIELDGLVAFERGQVFATPCQGIFDGCDFVESHTMFIDINFISSDSKDSPIEVADLQLDVYRALETVLGKDVCFDVKLSGFGRKWHTAHIPTNFDRSGPFGHGQTSSKIYAFIAK
jgi:hypothetical protein